MVRHYGGALPLQKGVSGHKLWLRKLHQNRYMLIMFLPGIFLFTLFKYVPMLGLIMAFQDYTFAGGLFGSEFVGLQHFRNLLSLPDFANVLRNTVWISFLKITFGFPAPIILALIFNEIKNKKFKRISQTISYLPHFFSWVVLSGLLISMLSPSSGAINAVIRLFGGTPIFFLANKHYFVPTLIITDIWQSVGWGSVIFLAAISGISPELYEAAIIDGAKRWQRIIHITIPEISSTIAIILILRMGGILDAGFDQIFNLYTPTVYEVADIIDTYMYRMGIGSFQYSFATAAGLFKSVIGITAVLTTNYVARKISDGEKGIW